MDTAETTAKAIDEKAVGVRKKRRTQKTKGPKIHRLKKASTKTITNRLYKAWAAIVYSCSDDRCAVCGRENTPSAPLNAHHVMPRQMFTGLRFDPNNGVALCPRCHKMGKFSAHKGGIWFAAWMKEHLVAKYNYCLEHMNDELDCKDRSLLYQTEAHLHEAYAAASPLPVFKVRAVSKDGTEHVDLVRAYNAKAAEFVVWADLTAYGHKIKGFLKTEEHTK